MSAGEGDWMLEMVNAANLVCYGLEFARTLAIFQAETLECERDLMYLQNFLIFAQELITNYASIRVAIG
jgi:hypothetical protein